MFILGVPVCNISDIPCLNETSREYITKKEEKTFFFWFLLCVRGCKFNIGSKLILREL